MFSNIPVYFYTDEISEDSQQIFQQNGGKIAPTPETAKVVVSEKPVSVTGCRKTPVARPGWITACVTSRKIVSPWGWAHIKQFLAGLEISTTGFPKEPLAKIMFLIRHHGGKYNPSLNLETTDVLIVADNSTRKFKMLSINRASSSTRPVTPHWLFDAVATSSVPFFERYKVPQPFIPDSQTVVAAPPTTPHKLFPSDDFRCATLLLLEPPITALGFSSIQTFTANGGTVARSLRSFKNRGRRTGYVLSNSVCSLLDSVVGVPKGNEWWLARCIDEGFMVPPVESELWSPVDVVIGKKIVKVHPDGSIPGNTDTVLAVNGELNVSRHGGARYCGETVTLHTMPAPSLGRAVCLTGYTDCHLGAVMFLHLCMGYTVLPDLPKYHLYPLTLVSATESSKKLTAAVNWGIPVHYFPIRSKGIKPTPLVVATPTQGSAKRRRIAVSV
eukprot:TRINITY_DN11302_c0_g1_i1.p1 TRINITY_DN11302_c0_g1~~TRINITY_DN11302_c0_g1_i1.p1  ORF type:complete len:443 (+),score=43.68 TRINITY_DN11302_c0_g1_i1:54-1382(+)